MISKAQPVPERLPPRMAVLFCIIYAVLGTFVFVSTQKIVSEVDINEPHISAGTSQENHGRIPERHPTQKNINISFLAPSDQSGQKSDNGETKKIRSVRVPNTFSYDVIQQPENNPFFVSSSRNLVTEFGLARKYNNIGLLAHNNLAGSLFKDLTLGQEIYITRQDDQSDRYIVSAIYRFQALEPDNTQSQFLDLDSGKFLNATELFNQMYTGPSHLTFQTCIDAQGDPSWGRLFVIAVPAGEAN